LFLFVVIEHEPSVFSVAVHEDKFKRSVIYIVYSAHLWCSRYAEAQTTGTGTCIYIKMTFLLVLHRGKKIEGLLQNFKKTALFQIVVQSGTSLTSKQFQILFLAV
jgi:hypothetical protein